MITDDKQADLFKNLRSPSTAAVRLAGRTAVLATMHGKDKAVAPVLKERLAIDIIVPRDLDTDQLGTFSGEIERPGSMDEILIRKARLGLTFTGRDLAIASEGSYGPHPYLPFVGAGLEKMVLLDTQAGLCVQEQIFEHSPCYHHLDIAAGTDIEPFLKRIAFPAHAVIVKALEHTRTRLVAKGIQDRLSLEQAIRLALIQAPQARLETDMRAHLNPTRMATIGRLAMRLAERLGCQCPDCGAPGWGIVGVEKGLPCSWCGQPSTLMMAEIWGCAACTHRENRPRPDGVTETDPANCAVCNP